MLVLSRHASETIRIGDNIVVSVQRISGNRVIIGIDAPQEVAIRRGELAFDGDAVSPADASKAPAKSVAAKAGSRISAQTGNRAQTSNKAPTGSKASSGLKGTGLAARTRDQERRPVIVPLGEHAADWSASHVS